MKRKFKLKLPKKEGHFYAVSIAEWRVDTDPEKIIRAMKAGGFNFTLIWVPLPKDAEYKIMEYVPNVDGVITLAHYKVEE